MYTLDKSTCQMHQSKLSKCKTLKSKSVLPVPSPPVQTTYNIQQISTTNETVRSTCFPSVSLSLNVTPKWAAYPSHTHTHTHRASGPSLTAGLNQSFVFGSMEVKHFLLSRARQRNPESLAQLEGQFVCFVARVLFYIHYWRLLSSMLNSNKTKTAKYTKYMETPLWGKTTVLRFLSFTLNLRSGESATCDSFRKCLRTKCNLPFPSSPAVKWELSSSRCCRSKAVLMCWWESVYCRH